MSLLYFFFGILSILAIASAIITISSRNPVRSAFALIFHFFMLAGLYLTLNAQFVAVIQILVYAGAIMVLVVFVIMLLNLSNEERLSEKFDFRRAIAVILGVAFVIQLLVAIFIPKSINSNLHPDSSKIGTAQFIGQTLFRDYLVPFEIVGILLISAIIGAIVLAKRKVD
ncbi:MAG: NADH-quinone oxidoreductase subunit J [Ignavibacteria bacterium]|nr:NADH-quinone oxidoreductase subunit J [Ignavibacteria bacterium]